MPDRAHTPDIAGDRDAGSLTLALKAHRLIHVTDESQRQHRQPYALPIFATTWLSIAAFDNGDG